MSTHVAIECRCGQWCGSVHWLPLVCMCCVCCSLRWRLYVLLSRRRPGAHAPSLIPPAHTGNPQLKCLTTNQVRNTRAISSRLWLTWNWKVSIEMRLIFPESVTLTLRCADTSHLGLTAVAWQCGQQWQKSNCSEMCSKARSCVPCRFECSSDRMPCRSLERLQVGATGGPGGLHCCRKSA